MFRAYTLPAVTAAAGLLAGAGPRSFLAAALAAAGAFWFCRGSRRDELCFVTLDPQAPDASVLPAALRQALDRARTRRRRVRLRVSPLPSGTGLRLQLALNRDGDVEIGDAGAQTALQRPGVWLADHPLPLALTCRESLCLMFEPASANRVRVSLPRTPPLRAWQWLFLLALAVTACVLDAAPLLAAALGFAFQHHLLTQQEGRAAKDAQIEAE